MTQVLQGVCWCCADGVTVYQVIQEEHWTMNRMDPEAMSDWVFETVEPGALQNPGYFKKLGFEIVVAGRDFGCGSKSVEHPMAALKASGIKLILAESFSRYSYRNAINLGLPVLACPGITAFAHRGDSLTVNIETGLVHNEVTGETLQGTGLGEFALGILQAGGLLNYIENERRNG